MQAPTYMVCKLERTEKENENHSRILINEPRPTCVHLLAQLIEQLHRRHPLLPVSIARQPQHLLARAQLRHRWHVLGHLAVHGLVNDGPPIPPLPLRDAPERPVSVRPPRGVIPEIVLELVLSELPLIGRYARLCCGKHRPNLRQFDVSSRRDRSSLIRRRLLRGGCGGGCGGGCEELFSLTPFSSQSKKTASNLSLELEGDHEGRGQR